MATKFLEPGGDATFNVALTTAGGFWGVINNTPTLATDFVHGSHKKSIGLTGGAFNEVRTPTGIIADAGGRVSFYAYFVALPADTRGMMSIETSAGGSNAQLFIRSTGILQLNAGVGNTAGTHTLALNKWYRISLAYTITSSSVNRFEVFVDGVSDISITNNTSVGTATSCVSFTSSIPATMNWRLSDIYVDDSSLLTDPGNIWVTAKRPNVNGTTNGFTTQIGSGGSGYGTGHSPQINERPLSTTNGWSMVGAGSAVTEEYNIENQATGDINLTGARIIDYIGWAYMSSLVGETVQMIVNGVNFAQAITSTNTMYTKVAGSGSYPAGTGTDIGITTDTSLTTVSLFECGIMVAYTPPIYVGSMLTMFQ